MEKFHKARISYKIALIIILITFIWMFSGVFVSREKYENRTITERNAVAESQLQTVRVMKVSSEQMMQNVSLFGKTESYREVELKTEESGRVESIDFEKGSFAREGTVILSLAVDDRKNLLDKAESDLKSKQISYEAKLSLKEKGLSSNSAVSSAKSDLELAKANVEKAKLDLEHTKIKAPFDGIIEDRYVEIGDVVSTGQSVVKIVDLDPIKVVGYISENIRNRVKLGNKVIVEFPNINRIVESKISYLASSANSATRTYKFEIEIPNKDSRFTEGLTCNIKVNIAKMNAHSIPTSLIVLNDKGILGIRTIDEDNIVHFLPVDFLTDSNEQIWLSGLPENFTVITVGQDFVKEGVKVNPIYEEER